MRPLEADLLDKANERGVKGLAKVVGYHEEVTSISKLNGGEQVSKLLPEHHSTIRLWIRDSYEGRRQAICNLIRGSKSSVHLSFDLWTASNGFHYVGVVGHFVDGHGKKRDVLLGLPRLVGPHSGENIGPHIKKVIDRHELGSKLGYFMLDNAESNDTCLQTLAQWYPMDVQRRRLRCVGHIINLVVRTVIFRFNAVKFESQLRAATDEFKFDVWAKVGAIGKLHNLATCKEHNHDETESEEWGPMIGLLISEERIQH
ncbi:hypothetical protein HIM_11658 [Hirsutella minnesotensis 3608]|uniref:Uncharacterized protein n=1 Tax=Hirsutella minnesotensis 3608 TaxID=1043627 RepID=A0A0F7ZWG7_9HYPO|nr:hypothetical protein HIM_11658 [Hirsutella minnesotensis 3608]